MKAYAVALFFLVFNLSLALMSDLQPFTLLAADPSPAIYFGYDQQLITDVSGYQNLSVSGLDTIDILGLIITLLNSIINATFGVPVLLLNIGAPPIMIALITVPIFYTYLAAVVQMTTGRIMPLFE